MATVSAGLLMYHERDGHLVVLLVHPGGPFWRHKDIGAWSIPKGELNKHEESAEAARREFREELGSSPEGGLQPLGRFRQRGGKLVDAFAIEGDFDVTALCSSTFEMEWPPKSARIVAFPEIDRAAWFSLPAARQKILPGQSPILDALENFLGRELDQEKSTERMQQCK
jgi:predicted NUDIX family NTP pyrophosphohydrolase